MNLREQLLTRPELKTDQVYLPDFGVTILIKAILACTRDEYELYMAQNVLKKQYRAMWIAMCVADLEGNLIFKKEDMEEIGETWTARDINIAFNKAAELNGMSEKESEEIKNE